MVSAPPDLVTQPAAGTAPASATVTTVDGVTLDADVYATPDARGAAVVAHGFGGSRRQPEVIALARILVGHGFAVVTYDSRGHGTSGGSCTLGDLERHDVAAAVGLARTVSDRVAVIGASMGAVAVLRHAADCDDLAGVVAVSSPAVWRVPRTIRGLLAAMMTRTPPGRWFAALHLHVRVSARWEWPEQPLMLARRIAAPLAVVHGESDRFVSSEDGLLLYSAVRGPRKVVIVPGMGHAFEPAALPAIVAALEWAWEGHGTTL